MTASSLGQSEIDAAIVAAAENWRLPRMPAVDRNVLRIGVFEMRDTTDPSPPAVVINEAIELARRYGSADSPSFVNGVLDQIKNQAVVSGIRSKCRNPLRIGLLNTITRCDGFGHFFLDHRPLITNH